MARTMFVNPALFENPRKRKGKKRKGRRGGKRRRYSARRRFRASGSIMMRRNAGITSFTQNPLILSNPRKRRVRRSNPMNVSSLKGGFNNALSYAGGAGLALTVTTVGTNKISNPWARRGAQLLGSVVGGSMLGKKSATMGGAFAGAMMYPLLQDLAADLLGITAGAAVAATTAKEADLDALAADLEDVLDEMDDDDSGYGDDDDDEEYAW